MNTKKNNLEVCAVLVYTEPKEVPYYVEITPSFTSLLDFQNYMHQNRQSFEIRTACIIDALGFNIFYCKLLVAIKDIDSGDIDIIDWDRRTLLN